jgi:hypothetical protein
MFFIRMVGYNCNFKSPPRMICEKLVELVLEDLSKKPTKEGKAKGYISAGFTDCYLIFVKFIR